MRTVHCPLCGLRFARVAELDQHAREDHAPATVLPHYEPRAHRGAGHEDVYPEGHEPVDHDQHLHLPW